MLVVRSHCDSPSGCGPFNLSMGRAGGWMNCFVDRWGDELGGWLTGLPMI